MNCATDEVKKFEQTLKDTGTTYEQFRELRKAWDDLSLGDKVAASNWLMPRHREFCGIPRILVTLGEVKRQAIYLKKLLETWKTVDDCIGHSDDGYHEEDIEVVIDGEKRDVLGIFAQFHFDEKKLKEANIKIQEVKIKELDRLFVYGVPSASYNRETGAFVFDVADVNYSHYENLLENVTLNNLDEEFEKMLKAKAHIF